MTARDIVHRALAHQAERYPDLDLAPLDVSGLDARDAAFAHAVYDSALRRWVTLGFLIDGFVARGFGSLEPRVRGVLLAGAAQLLLLERVPPHAALNESVDWVKVHVKPAAAGLVNAVLRRVSELVHGFAEGLPEQAERVAWTQGRDQLPLGDGTAVVLRLLAFPEPMLERVAIATSHPVALVARWARAFGEEAALRLAIHGLVMPPTVLYTQFATAGVEGSVPHAEPGHCVFSGSRGELVRLLERERDVWVQDAASSKAVASVAGMTPAVVIDACAGQGTKTRQLAETFPKARIIATDVDERRLGALRAVARRHANVQVIEPGALRAWTGRADLVLLDVPCSNSGVLPRRVEARYRCDGAQMERLVGVQREILREGAALARKGGAVVYSTCSIEMEENEHQVAWAEKTLGMRASGALRTMPAGQPGDDPAGYHDGSFSALLTKR